MRIPTIKFCIMVSVLAASSAAPAAAFAFQQGFASLEEAYQAKLVSIRLSSSSPKVGEGLVAYIQETAIIQKYELLIAAALNGQSQNIQKTAGTLWTADLGEQLRVQDNVLEVQVTARNIKDRDRLLEALGEIEKEILTLQTKIDNEADPEKKAVLLALLQEKTSAKARFQGEFDALPIYLGLERFSFRTEGDSQNENFPRLIRVVPGVGLEAGGQANRILARNLPPNPQVKIGGVSAVVVSSTDSEIRFTSPALTGLGSKDVEVTFLDNPKNAPLKAGFFVSPSTTILKNTRPVAVAATGFFSTTLPTPVAFSGASTYDENGDTLSHAWIVRRAPSGSSFVPGTVWRTSRSPTFTPDVLGIFVFEYKAKEVGTLDLLESFPSFVTVEVK